MRKRKRRKRRRTKRRRKRRKRRTRKRRVGKKRGYRKKVWQTKRWKVGKDQQQLRWGVRRPGRPPGPEAKWRWANSGPTGGRSLWG